MQEILEVNSSAINGAKSSKNSQKGDAELFASELEAASEKLEAAEALKDLENAVESGKKEQILPFARAKSAPKTPNQQHLAAIAYKKITQTSGLKQEDITNKSAKNTKEIQPSSGDKLLQNLIKNEAASSTLKMPPAKRLKLDDLKNINHLAKLELAQKSTKQLPPENLETEVKIDNKTQILNDLAPQPAITQKPDVKLPSTMAIISAVKNTPKTPNTTSAPQSERSKAPNSLDLFAALQVDTSAEKSQVQASIKHLDKTLSKVIKKLDEKIKHSAKIVAKEPDILKDFLTKGLDTKTKIKDIIKDAKALNETLPKRLQISKDELLDSIKTELAQDKNYGKELLEDLSFTKLLDLAQSLKTGQKNPDLSGVFKLSLSAAESDKISKVASAANSVKELINNLKDKLAVSKMTMERVQNEEYNPQIFAEKFPKLYDDGFFATTLSAAIAAQPERGKIPTSKLLEAAPGELAKKAVSSENIDLSALKSGKLNELLSSLRTESNKVAAKIEQLPQQLAAQLSEKTSELSSEAEQILSDVQSTEESKIQAPIKEANQHDHLVHNGLKTDLKTAFVSGEKLSKDEARAVIDNFAQDFKDELAKFKAPLTRVSIALRPAELGEINVTMMARGQNLQVNLQTANASTMNMFLQNQQEIRQALVNMGFTGLSMNFSSGGEGGSRQQQDRQKHPHQQDSEDDESMENPAPGVNFTLQKYL